MTFFSSYLFLTTSVSFHFVFFCLFYFVFFCFLFILFSFSFFSFFFHFVFISFCFLFIFFSSSFVLFCFVLFCYVLFCSILIFFLPTGAFSDRSDERELYNDEIERKFSGKGHEEIESNAQDGTFFMR